MVNKCDFSIINNIKEIRYCILSKRLLEKSKGGTMKEVRFEYLRPRQILDAIQEKPIVYLPVSPIEWHDYTIRWG